MERISTNALAVTFGTLTRSKTSGIKREAKNFLIFGTRAAARGVPKNFVKQKLLSTCEYFLKFMIYFCGDLWFNTLMKFETGTQVHHRDNPNWKAVVVRDLEPRRPVNGVVAVNHNGRVSGMSKTLLRVSFHADAKKEFGEVVR